MRIIQLILFLGIALPIQLLAQKPDSIRISLVGIQVGNLDSSIFWYSTYLNFELGDKKEFKEAGLKIAFLKRDNIELELVENKKALSKQAVLKEKKATDLTGFAKLTFKISNIQEVYNQMRSTNVNFIVPLKKSTRKNDEMFFIIADNESNLIQFAGKVN